MNADASVIVIGVDITMRPRARTLTTHPRIRMIEGSSTDSKVISLIKSLLPSSKGGFVSLDSDHSEKHVSEELAIYKEFVGLNSYLVVEDTNINGHPVLEGWGAGPFEATETFIKQNQNFTIDNDVWRRNFFTSHHWLKRGY